MCIKINHNDEKNVFIQIAIVLLIVSFFKSVGQTKSQAPSLNDNLKSTNFYEIQKSFELYEKEFDQKNELAKNKLELEESNEGGKFPGYKNYKRWEWYMDQRVYPSGDISLPSTKFQEFHKYLQSKYYLDSKRNASKTRSNWTPLGPTGTHWSGYFGGAARVTFLRIDPTNSNIMWTAAPSGGLWKTTNGGLNWNSNTDQLPIIGCTDIAINPLNSQIMYLATGDGNGTGSQLWQSSNGILKSTDGGQTWPLISNTMNWQVGWNRSIYKLLIHPTHPDTVFAATSNGLYRTINGGVNWLIMQAGIFTDVEFKPGNPNIVYAVSGVQANGTFYKSTNAGTTFVATAVGVPSPLNVGRLSIAVTAADSNYLYLVAVKKVTNDFYGFYRSTDGGDNFSLMSTTPNILAGAGPSNAQAWYNLAMAVSPLHKDTVIVGGTESWRTTDGGLTWAKHTSSNGFVVAFVHPDFHDIVFSSNNDSSYFTCNDGGVWKTTDYGVTWNPMNEGMQIAQMYKLGTSKINPYTIITGHQDMATHRLQGTNWDMVTRNTGDGMECIYENDNDTIMYLESNNGRVIKTINTFPLFSVVCSYGGSGVNATGSWITPLVMHPQYDTVLLVGKAQVWRTVNAGTSFTQVGSIPAAGNLVALAYAPSNTNFIYAAKQTQFFVTTDGNTFVDRTAGLPVVASKITAIAVSDTHPEKVWVTFSGYNASNKVWVSSDTGLTWTNYSTGLPNLPVNCITYQNNTNNVIYVGTDVGVYFKSDTIPTWQPYFMGLPNVDVQELEIAYGINKIRAATNGRGLWECNLPIPSIPLALELISFTGQFNGIQHTNDLQWKTTAEVDCDYFEIMKSKDSKHFVSIATTKATNQTTQLNEYSYSDKNNIGGTNYYYLKQYDKDGHYTISNLVSIFNAELDKTITLFPNPANEFIEITYTGESQNYDIELYDVMGDKIFKKSSILLDSKSNYRLNISALRPATYFINVINRSTGAFMNDKFVKK